MTNQGPNKLKGNAKNVLEGSMKWINKSSFAKQMITGTASGWLTGAVLGHASKGIALFVGSGILLAQIAQHKGYMADWPSIKAAAEKKTQELGCNFSKSAPQVSKVKTFATKNRTFTAAFLGGLLLGIAS